MNEEKVKELIEKQIKKELEKMSKVTKELNEKISKVFDSIYTDIIKDLDDCDDIDQYYCKKGRCAMSPSMKDFIQKYTKKSTQESTKKSTITLDINVVCPDGSIMNVKKTFKEV